jgi:hypothetical protein
MSFSKKKKKDFGYRSKVHIQSHIADICSSSRTAFLISDAKNNAINEVCEEIMSEDYEDEIVRAFSNNKDGGAAVQAFCTEVTDSCSAAEFAALPEAMMAPSVIPFGPLPLSIMATEQNSKNGAKKTPQEKAMELAKKEANSAPPRAKPAKKSPPAPTETPTKPQLSSADEELDAIAMQDFLDNQENSGGLTSEQHEELLRRTFIGDKALLRCYRLNHKKGEKKLLARMKLLLGAKTSSPQAKPSAKITEKSIPTPDEL